MTTYHIDLRGHCLQHACSLEHIVHACSADRYGLMDGYPVYGWADAIRSESSNCADCYAWVEQHTPEHLR